MFLLTSYIFSIKFHFDSFQFIGSFFKFFLLFLCPCLLLKWIVHIMKRLICYKRLHFQLFPLNATVDINNFNFKIIRKNFFSISLNSIHINDSQYLKTIDNQYVYKQIMSLLKIYFFIDLIKLLKLKKKIINIDYPSIVFYFIFIFCRYKKIYEMLNLTMNTKYDIYLFVISLYSLYYIKYIIFLYKIFCKN